MNSCEFIYGPLRLFGWDRPFAKFTLERSEGLEGRLRPETINKKNSRKTGLQQNCPPLNPCRAGSIGLAIIE